jgi:hypothetical protein
MSQLEELARELESLHDRQDELKEVIAHARDDSYDRATLTQELIDARLGFFAHKLATEYYDQNRDNFVQSLNQQTADAEAAQIAKEALSDEQQSEQMSNEQPTATPSPEQTPQEPATPEQQQPEQQQEQVVEEQPTVNPEPLTEGQDPKPGMTTTDSLMHEPDAPNQEEVVPEPHVEVSQDEHKIEITYPEELHTHDFSVNFTCSCGAFDEQGAPDCTTCLGKHVAYTKQHHTTEGV